MVGWNCRMDGIQGAVLQIKLRRLEEANNRRRAHAARYTAALAEAARAGELTLPTEAPFSRHVYHLYVLRVKERDEVMRRLGEEGVACGVHYPIPIHLQEAYRHLGHAPGSFPIAEQAATEFISLPMFPELTPAQVEFVAEKVRAVVRNSATCAATC
jgi:dTDP-4-amino-4,6-dideoxygalactose transaminase